MNLPIDRTLVNDIEITSIGDKMDHESLKTCDEILFAKSEETLVLHVNNNWIFFVQKDDLVNKPEFIVILGMTNPFIKHDIADDQDMRKQAHSRHQLYF